jgi:hypothetical protein
MTSSPQGGRVYALPAVKDTHSVTVTFQLPSLQAAYAAKVNIVLLGITKACCGRTLYVTALQHNHAGC